MSSSERAEPSGRPELAKPPWPGLVLVTGGVVRIAASPLWPEHESVAAPCWLAPSAQLVDHDTNVAAPELAQLAWAVAADLVQPPEELEQTSSELVLLSASGVPAAGVPLAVGRGQVVAADPALLRARQMVPLGERRPCL